ncbi:MAG: hypothetical protein JSV86_05970 [Gemmatimonadota bacterium]|nr:MAG: hypothetical protein JSV86_05970 [Gemmatimonadota bacterium]
MRDEIVRLPPVEEGEEEITLPPVEQPQRRKAGRPKGSKDKQPRRRPIKWPKPEEPAARKDTDRGFVLAELLDNIRLAKRAKPEMDRQGRPTGRFVVDLTAANRSLELIAKIEGLLTERLAVTGLEERIKGKSVDELEEVIRQAILAVGPTTIRRLLGQVESAEQAEPPSPEKMN